MCVHGYSHYRKYEQKVTRTLTDESFNSLKFVLSRSGANKKLEEFIVWVKYYLVLFVACEKWCFNKQLMLQLLSYR